MFVRIVIITCILLINTYISSLKTLTLGFSKISSKKKLQDVINVIAKMFYSTHYPSFIDILYFFSLFKDGSSEREKIRFSPNEFALKAVKSLYRSSKAANKKLKRKIALFIKFQMVWNVRNEAEH